MDRHDATPIEAADVLLAAIELSSDAAVIIDGSGRVGWVNAAAERLFRCDRADAVGQDLHCLGILPDLDLQADTDAVEPSTREITLSQAGSTVHVSLSWSRLVTFGEPLTVLFARDVTSEAGLREQTGLLTSVVNRSNRAIVVTDRDMKILFVNAAFARMFGYTPEQALGRRADKLLIGPHTDRKTAFKLRRWLSKYHGGEEEILAYDRNGDEVWLSAFVKAQRNEHGRIKYMFALLSDIGETKQLRSLQQLIMTALADEQPIATIADQLCRRVEELAPDVVSSLLHVDSEGVIHPLGGPSLPVAYSQALEGIVIGPDIGSCGTAAYLGEPVLAIDIETDPRWLPYNALPLAVGLCACWSTPIMAKDGRVIGTFAFYFRESRAPSRWHQRIVDACVHLGALAIERKEARAEIAKLAYYDMLTGLPNRAHICALISDTMKACPAGEHIALAFLDADNFKDINDTLGHFAGDAVLVAFADRLRGQMQPGDLLGRLGGDEFVIMLPNRNPVEVELMVAHISAALAGPFPIENRLVPMSASIGISLYPDNASDLETLIKQADAAMYKAKQAGRSTYRFFSADMDKIAEQRLIHSTALRAAIGSAALSLHYQPQIRTRDGTIHGVEALARWCDPVLGEVSPTKFIPLAEECGLIEQIGLWSMKEACQQMAIWRREGLYIPSVSVNLSPINFQNGNLVAVVAQILADHDLPPNLLMLEITEGVFINERATVIKTMNELRALGVSLSLDDFGTGYSSLSRLTQLPIHELKIDGSFMRNLDRDAGARAIVTAVVRVGQSLGLAVVAEGVETEAQRLVLAELGCEAVQGFLYARALSADDFGRWLLDYGTQRVGVMLRDIARANKPAIDAPALVPSDVASRPALKSVG